MKRKKNRANMGSGISHSPHIGVSTSNKYTKKTITNPVDTSQFHRTPYYCEENVYLLCKTLCTNGMADAKGTDLFVLFISNEKKQNMETLLLSGFKMRQNAFGNPIENNHQVKAPFCFLTLEHETRVQTPLWHQKASRRADGVVLWDYHVICVQRQKEGNNTSHLVWDLDSSLPFPSPLSSYVAETIRPSFQLLSEFQRVFRIVHAPIFLRSFASDRRHMKDSEGNWTHEPPPHEPLVAEDGSVHNLNEYIEISTKDVAKSVGPDLVDEVFTQKLGVLVSESQLEEFFSLLIT